jgi:YD repeat-containing protein
VTLPSLKKVKAVYDQNFRKTSITSGYGTSEAATTNLGYNAVGNLTSVQDPLTQTATFGYDARNRRTSAKDPLNHGVDVTYDAASNILTETRANGELITFDSYDEMNRLLQKTVHRNSNADVTTMDYDLAGNLTAFTDERANPYIYHYDALNRQIDAVYPNSLTEAYTYDFAGNLATRKNRNNAVQTFVNDNRNRPQSFSWSDGTSSVSTAYDAASRVMQITNANATINFTYFDDNLLRTQEEWTSYSGDNNHRTVTYTYDADGNRKTTLYPSGYSFTYNYTNRNQLQSILNNANQTTPASYVYDLDGRLTSRTLDNGTSSTYGFDIVNRVTSIQHNLTTGVRSFGYAFNEVNDITAVQRDSGLGDGFLYDQTQQITTFQQDGTVNLGTGIVTNPASTLTLGFDANGNRTAVNGVNLATPNNLNQPTDAGIGHDNNGNLSGWNGWTYTYDAQNRLVSAVKGTDSAYFYYDGLNRQVARNVNGQIIYSVWDGWTLLEEWRAGNVLDNAYLSGVTGLVKSLTAGNYFYQDRIGSTSHLANSSGQLLESYRYDLFGKPTV